MSNEAIVIDTPEGIEVFRLLAVKGALNLEQVGLKSRGGSIRKGWAIRLGLKPTAKYPEVIEAIERKLAQLGHPTYVAKFHAAATLKAGPL